MASGSAIAIAFVTAPALPHFKAPGKQTEEGKANYFSWKQQSSSASSAKHLMTAYFSPEHCLLCLGWLDANEGREILPLPLISSKIKSLLNYSKESIKTLPRFVSTFFKQFGKNKDFASPKKTVRENQWIEINPDYLNFTRFPDSPRQILTDEGNLGSAISTSEYFWVPNFYKQVSIRELFKSLSWFLSRSGSTISIDLSNCW